MSAILLALLVVVWAVLLVPALRGRRRYPDSPTRSVWRFGRTMDALARSRAATPVSDARWILVPLTESDRVARDRASAATRRRRLFAALVLTAAVTVPAAVRLGGSWWVGQIAADALLVAYCWFLIEHGRRRSGRRRVVRQLREPVPQLHAQPVLLEATAGQPVPGAVAATPAGDAAAHADAGPPRAASLGALAVSADGATGPEGIAVAWWRQLLRSEGPSAPHRP